MRLVADDSRVTHGWEEALERLRVFHARGIIQSEDIKDVAGFEADTRLLDKLNDAILGRDKRHVHLHDLSNRASDLFNLSVGMGYLNFHIRLTSTAAGPAINQEPNELSRSRASQLRRVILLLNQARLRVSHDPQCTDFLAPVHKVSLVVEKNERQP